MARLERAQTAVGVLLVACGVAMMCLAAVQVAAPASPWRLPPPRRAACVIAAAGGAGDDGGAAVRLRTRLAKARGARISAARMGAGACG